MSFYLINNKNCDTIVQKNELTLNDFTVDHLKIEDNIIKFNKKEKENLENQKI